MTQNELSFESEKLVVDYISFNLEGLMDPASMDKIASYLSKLFGFNSTLGKGNGAKPKEEIIFYNLIKAQRFDWSIFEFNHQTLSKFKSI
jgi:hypothetical protein